MYTYAQIDANNNVVAISQLTSENNNPSLISISEYDESLLGLLWDGASFIDPPESPTTENEPTTIMTKLSFMRLFSTAELINVLTAAKTDPIVEVMMMKLDLALEVDLLDQDTIDGINYLESTNIIDTGRAAQILSNTHLSQ